MKTGLELDTRSKLLKAAVSIFGKYGFAGASVRQIADVAGVNHGSIKYHYSSKRDLWCATVSYLYDLMENAVMANSHRWGEMTPRERIIDSTRNYVRFSAAYPELQRIILFETILESERGEWLSDNFIRPFTDRAINFTALAQEQGVYSDKVPAMNLYYISQAASRSLFVMAADIQRNFGVDVFEESEIERHIDAIVELLVLPEREAADAPRAGGGRNRPANPPRKPHKI
ncbi:TetR/AcrR family transcriptional regulator [Novosphingobium sp. Gsoil 351]|uniref:TetR/AcrR family transcriptional regulator n=1 Tax=Novosphingobium sp. Gsoil 351 TaxID=2675225 RepID=UPI0012B4F86E|nr:TetR/AcrR family transcriptional regulator [Novosphingobium sp. Gsoil 351]QGN55800.1 TetR family transcriptional regulator [Novosphingobium sp. Gsoil 351]